MKTINIGKEFSDTPWGRYEDDGPYNGQKFRESFLVPALQESEKVSVRIDEVEGYGSSFLEEAFGGLVRAENYSAKDLEKKLTIECLNPVFNVYRHLIWQYIKEAKK